MTPEKPTVTAEDIEKNPHDPIERMLQAKASGVSVMRAPNGEIVVRIRGSTSFTNTDEPLYLLDGMPFEPGDGGLLSGVDPYNIESIRLLKGADAVLHGIRGMNGVIAITTKKAGNRTPE